MKIEELISGKNDDEKLLIDGISISASALKNLLKEGYENLKPYKEEKTFAVWGKTCTACLNEEQLQNRA
jgi:hypothetical protein